MKLLDCQSAYYASLVQDYTKLVVAFDAFAERESDSEENHKKTSGDFIREIMDMRAQMEEEQLSWEEIETAHGVAIEISFPDQPNNRSGMLCWRTGLEVLRWLIVALLQFSK